MAVNQRFGLAWVMVGFALLAVLAIVFVVRFIPETKDVQLETVIHRLERQAAK